MNRLFISVTFLFSGLLTLSACGRGPALYLPSEPKNPAIPENPQAKIVFPEKRCPVPILSCTDSPRSTASSDEYATKIVLEKKPPVISNSYIHVDFGIQLFNASIYLDGRKTNRFLCVVGENSACTGILYTHAAFATGDLNPTRLINNRFSTLLDTFLSNQSPRSAAVAIFQELDISLSQLFGIDSSNPAHLQKWIQDHQDQDGQLRILVGDNITADRFEFYQKEVGAKAQTVVVQLSTLLFGPDLDALPPESYDRLIETAHLIQMSIDQIQSIQVIAYTDREGLPVENISLSKRRADRISQFLERGGIIRSKMAKPVGKGPRSPSYCSTRTCPQDRSAELVITSTPVLGRLFYKKLVENLNRIWNNNDRGVQ